MTVRSRGNGYQADLTFDGKRHRPLFETADAAHGWEADAKAAYANGRPIPEAMAEAHGARPGTVTLKQACDGTYAIEYAHVTSAWPATAKRYMDLYCKFWGDHTSIKSVATADEVARITADWRARGNAAGTINAKLSVLSKVFGWAADPSRRYITHVPKLKRGQVGDNARESFLSDAEEKEIAAKLAQLGRDDELDAFVCLLDTGFRPSELWRFTGADAGPEGARGELPLYVRTGKTKAAKRRIYATPRVKEIILRRRTAYGLVKLFPGMDNERMLGTWDIVRRMMGRLDDPEFVPYICRHTCASRMVQRGVLITVIQKWMGHANIQTTLRYAKHAPEDLVAAAATLAQGTA
jgi:integrase